MNDAPFRFSIRTMLLALFFLSYVLAAYTRGDYLLGRGAGVMYAVVASVLAVLFYRALSDNRTSKLTFGVLIVVTVLASAAFAFPSYLNPDMQHFVNAQAEERNARQELAELLASDPAFSDLGVTMTQLKILNVEIQGSVPTDSDLERLRSGVLDKCDFVRYSYIHWKVEVRDSGKVFSGSGV